MSQPRFAPITAGLLARKGNAAPSAMTGAPAPVSFTPVMAKPVEPPPFAESAPEPDVHNKKLFVSLSHPEHERLAIAAVKTGLTRHQIVRDALDIYFEQLLSDMGHDCRCVAGTACTRSC